MSKRWSLALASAMITLSVAACGSPGQPGAPADNGTAGAGGASGNSGAPYKVGLVYSKSGPLATYGQQYRQGLWTFNTRNRRWTYKIGFGSPISRPIQIVLPALRPRGGNTQY